MLVENRKLAIYLLDETFYENIHVGRVFEETKMWEAQASR